MLKKYVNDGDMMIQPFGRSGKQISKISLMKRDSCLMLEKSDQNTEDRGC